MKLAANSEILRDVDLVMTPVIPDFSVLNKVFSLRLYIGLAKVGELSKGKNIRHYTFRNLSLVQLEMLISKHSDKTLSHAHCANYPIYELF